MLTSAGYPPNSVTNLRINTLWDGLFHISTYIFVAIGLFLLWRAAHQRHVHWSGKMLIGTILMGFGTFNLVEGIIDHHLLGIHHVNETVPPDQWIYWDVGFLIWGAAMLIGGWRLLKAGQHETAEDATGKVKHTAPRGKRVIDAVSVNTPGLKVSMVSGILDFCNQRLLALERPLTTRNFTQISSKRQRP